MVKIIKKKFIKAPRKRRRVSQSIRNVLQCKSNTVKKERCRKRTAHTKKCWIHLAKENNLRIKKSTIPNAGKGLFAWKNRFNPKKTIIEYTGHKTNQEALDRRYGQDCNANYSICDNADNCLDADLSTYSAARFANNGKRKSKYKNNSYFTYDPYKDKYFLESSKRIKPNEEILADYGKNYWKRKKR